MAGSVSKGVPLILSCYERVCAPVSEQVGLLREKFVSYL